MDLFLLFPLKAALHWNSSLGWNQESRVPGRRSRWRVPVLSWGWRKAFCCPWERAGGEEWSQAMYEMGLLKENGYESRKVCVLKKWWNSFLLSVWSLSAITVHYALKNEGLFCRASHWLFRDIPGCQALVGSYFSFLQRKPMPFQQREKIKEKKSPLFFLPLLLAMTRLLQDGSTGTIHRSRSLPSKPN